MPITTVRAHAHALSQQHRWYERDQGLRAASDPER
jgi:hypothetical protein